MFHKIKWFIQRGTRGYADCDVWDLDAYLCSWLPQAIRQLRDTGWSYPIKETNEKWKLILSEMADGFEAHYKLTQLCDENYQELETKFKKGLRLFVKYFSCLWD